MTLTFEIQTPKININYSVIEHRLKRLDFVDCVFINKKNRLIEVYGTNQIHHKSPIILNTLYQIGYTLEKK